MIKVFSLIIVMFLMTSSVLGTVGPTDGSLRSPALDGAIHAQVESPSNETIHVFDIPSSELVRSTVETRHVDLGPSLGFSALRVDEQIQTGASLERIGPASGDSTRQRLIPGKLNDTERRVITLQNAQRSVIERFNDGNLITREPLIELARIDVGTRALSERRVVLRDATSRVSGFSISSGRPAALERELDTFIDLVRTHVAVVMTGEADATWFSMRMSETRVVLSVVASGEYVHEAHRTDLYDHDQYTVTYEEALGIVVEGYPTIYSSRTARNGTNVISVGDSHRVRINYNYGQSTAYADIGSRCVFKESQTRPLRSISIIAIATGVRDGLVLTVDRTYPGEPLHIQLNESGTGNPVDVNVTTGLEASQESTLLDHTDSGRTLWTVSLSAPYTVTVIKGNSTVVFIADPTPAPTLITNPTDTENNTSPTVIPMPTESIESPGPSRMVSQGTSGNSPTVGSPTVG